VIDEGAGGEFQSGVRGGRSWRWFGRGRLRSMQQGNPGLSRRGVVTRRIDLANAEEGVGITGVASSK